MKTCSRCGEDKELDAFHRHPQMADGHLNICKACRHIDAIAYYAKTRERQLAAKAEWRAQNVERKRAIDAEYRARPGNAEKQRAYNTEYYKQNGDRLKARTAEWAAQNVTRKREYDTAYRSANREKLRAWHREHRKTPARAAAEKLKNAVRRALKKGVAAIPFTAAELEAKWRFWNGCCWVCGDRATTWDHFKPLTAGGAHALCNMRPACQSCNSAKNNRWPVPSRAVILGFAE